MMSAAPRDRHVFEMPRTATAADANMPLPASWGAGDAACQGTIVQRPSRQRCRQLREQHCTVSINAAHFTQSDDVGAAVQASGRAFAHWNVLGDLGISGALDGLRTPRTAANLTLGRHLQPAAWLDYDFTTTTSGSAMLALHLLPTFAIDSDPHLRYAVAIDSAAPAATRRLRPRRPRPDTAT